MSFSSQVKTELCEIRLAEKYKEPFIYGFLLFSRSFSAKGIKMQTETKAVARIIQRLLYETFSVNTDIKTGGEKRKVYRLEVLSEADRLRLLASVDFGIYDGSINIEAIGNSSAEAAFIRGAFLACGQISDPEKNCRADFFVRDKARADEFRELLLKHYIQTNISSRQNGYVIYIKKNEMITNLLTLMGASARSLELIEMSIINSVKNNMNRAANCDNANLDRMVEASIRQRKAIDYLDKKGVLQTLDSGLISAAKLRRQNPDVSIKELCGLSNEPISASGLSHRLKKLVDIYEEKSKK